jgi:hypothetical protein
VGSGSLAKFPSAANLYGYIHAAMPFQKPNSLTDEEYYQIVSFLLRQNGLIDAGVEVNASNAAQIVVSHATPTPVTQQSSVQEGSGTAGWLILIALFTFLLILLVALKKSRNTTTI